MESVLSSESFLFCKNHQSNLPPKGTEFSKIRQGLNFTLHLPWLRGRVSANPPQLDRIRDFYSSVIILTKSRLPGPNKVLTWDLQKQRPQASWRKHSCEIHPETDCWVGTLTYHLQAKCPWAKHFFYLSFLTSKMEIILISQGCYEEHMDQYMQSTYNHAWKYQEGFAVLLSPLSCTRGHLYLCFCFPFPQ